MLSESITAEDSLTSWPVLRALEPAPQPCQSGSIQNQHNVGGDMRGHASELPIQLRDDLAYSFGSTSRSWDNVLGSPMTITPQLPRGAIHCLLGGSDGIDCGCESLHDAKVVMNDVG